MNIALSALFSIASGSVLAAPATQPVSLFDPARHMRVEEVRPGMKGYGLSVFQGTKIERFQVEVVSVLHHFNPRRDVVLIRASGQNLEHTGSIQGMSGSPIYLTDADGKERMIGAFAYGFPFAKDPIAGVQPIEYMLELPTALHTEAEVEGSGRQDRTIKSAQASWRVDQMVADVRSRWMSPPIAPPSDSTRLAPLITPIAVSGMSARQLQELLPVFTASNLSLVQSGGTASSGGPDTPPVEIEPGSVLAAPVLTGDVQLIATGTVTEVIGDNVFAFGHPFNGEGPISLPFASGSVNGIVAAITTSYKLGAMDRVRGTLSTDQTVGIAGRLGEAPKTIPIDLDLRYADGSVPPEKYHFDLALHPTFSPMMSGMAMVAALSGARELPRNHTIEYDLTIEFSNGRKVHHVNHVVNGGPRALASELVIPVQLGMDNPFQKLTPAKIAATVNITPTALSATIISAKLNKQDYRPGETISGFVRYRPFRGEETTMPIEFALPRDLPDGPYQLAIGDADRYLADEATHNAWKFSATNADQLLDALQGIANAQRDSIYIRLVRPGDGVAVGRTPMPKLPVSRRALLMASGRADVSAMSSGDLKIIPTSLVFEGQADVIVNVKANPHAEHTAGGVKASGTTNPSTPPQRPVTP